MQEFGKTFIMLGAFLIGVGFLLLVAHKLPGIGRLPGDILVRKGNFTFYFPLATSLLLSMILSLVFYWIGKR